MTDNRKPITIELPIRRVTRLQANPEGQRYYCVMQKMKDDNGKYAGWLHVSKGYIHSTSAFAALGRLVQKDVAHIQITE